VRQHFLTPKLHKKQVHLRGCMSFVTYCNIWLKCYIKLFNVFYIVAGVKRGSNVLANAIDVFYHYYSNLNRICYLFSSTYSAISFVTISFTVVFCFSATILRSVLSVSSISTTNCFLSLMLITTFVSCISICKGTYKYIFIVI